MISIKQRYTELIALAQLHLLQEYAISDRLYAEKETYAYFRSQAARQATPSPSSRQVSTQIPAASPITKASTTAPTPPPPKAKDSIATANELEKIPVTIEQPKAIPASIEKKAPFSSIPQEVSKTKGAKEIEKSSFALEMPPAAEEVDLNDIRKIISERVPHLKLIDDIPKDTEAKKNAALWQNKQPVPQVMILSFDETLKQKVFLDDLCFALEIYGIHAKIFSTYKIEQEKGWEPILKTQELRLVIANSHGIHGFPELMKHYREVPRQARHYLQNIPLFLLSDLSFYFKEPALKLSLWKALQGILR